MRKFPLVIMCFFNHPVLKPKYGVRDHNILVQKVMFCLISSAPEDSFSSQAISAVVVAFTLNTEYSLLKG